MIFADELTYLNNPNAVLQREIDLSSDDFLEQIRSVALEILRVRAPSLEEIHVEPLTGGITNILYVVTVSASSKPPEKVLTAIYYKRCVMYCLR